MLQLLRKLVCFCIKASLCPFPFPTNRSFSLSSFFKSFSLGDMVFLFIFTCFCYHWILWIDCHYAPGTGSRIKLVSEDRENMPTLSCSFSCWLEWHEDTCTEFAEILWTVHNMTDYGNTMLYTQKVFSAG